MGTYHKSAMPQVPAMCTALIHTTYAATTEQFVFQNTTSCVRSGERDLCIHDIPSLLLIPTLTHTLPPHQHIHPHLDRLSPPSSLSQTTRGVVVQAHCYL